MFKFHACGNAVSTVSKDFLWFSIFGGSGLHKPDGSSSDYAVGEQAYDGRILRKPSPIVHDVSRGAACIDHQTVGSPSGTGCGRQPPYSVGTEDTVAICWLL